SVDQAAVKSAQIALDRAKQNLGYTNIYSPIDGVVVARDVDVGQTVAASLSAPELFLLANDMSTMQILASVDESDIGRSRTANRWSSPSSPIRIRPSRARSNRCVCSR